MAFVIVFGDIFCECLMYRMQLNIHVYIRTLNGEAFVSQLMSVHSPLYYLPETGIARLVVSSSFSADSGRTLNYFLYHY